MLLAYMLKAFIQTVQTVLLCQIIFQAKKVNVNTGSQAVVHVALVVHEVPSGHMPDNSGSFKESKQCHEIGWISDKSEIWVGCQCEQSVVPLTK